MGSLPARLHLCRRDAALVGAASANPRKRACAAAVFPAAFHCHGIACGRDPAGEGAAVDVAVRVPVNEIAGLVPLPTKSATPQYDTVAPIHNGSDEVCGPVTSITLISWSGASFTHTIACEFVFPINDPEALGMCSSPRTVRTADSRFRGYFEVIFPLI